MCEAYTRIITYSTFCPNLETGMSLTSIYQQIANKSYFNTNMAIFT